MRSAGLAIKRQTPGGAPCASDLPMTTQPSCLSLLSSLIPRCPITAPAVATAVPATRAVASRAVARHRAVAVRRPAAAAGETDMYHHGADAIHGMCGPTLIHNGDRQEEISSASVPKEEPGG